MVAAHILANTFRTMILTHIFSVMLEGTARSTHYQEHLPSFQSYVGHQGCGGQCILVAFFVEASTVVRLGHTVATR